MPYLMLCGAMLSFSIQFITMKIFRRKVSGSIVVSLAFSMVFGVIISIVAGIFGGLNFNTGSLVRAFIHGVLVVVYALVGIIASGVGNIGVYSTFPLLGAIACPAVFGTIAYGDSLSIYNAIGLVLMIFSLFIPLIDECGKGQSSKRSKRDKFLFWAMCFSGFAINGIAGIVCSLQGVKTPDIHPMAFVCQYMAFTAIISAICLLTMLIIPKTRQSVKESRVVFSPRSLLLATIYGAGGMGGNALCIASLNTGLIQTSVQYPFCNGGSIVVTTLIGAIAFKERTGIFTKIGLAITLLSTILFLF